jgi:hypothetical protein
MRLLETEEVYNNIINDTGYTIQSVSLATFEYDKSDSVAD